MARLFVIYLALLALLGLTFYLSGLDLGRWALAIALSIAVVKTCLILWHYMDLRQGSPLLRIIFVAGLVWIIFFYSFSALDVAVRQSPQLEDAAAQK